MSIHAYTAVPRVGFQMQQRVAVCAHVGMHCRCAGHCKAATVLLSTCNLGSITSHPASVTPLPASTCWLQPVPGHCCRHHKLGIQNGYENGCRNGCQTAAPNISMMHPFSLTSCFSFLRSWMLMKSAHFCTGFVGFSPAFTFPPCGCCA